MGLGEFFTENLVYDPSTGELLSAGTFEYKPPFPLDIPQKMTVVSIDNTAAAGCELTVLWRAAACRSVSFRGVAYDCRRRCCRTRPTLWACCAPRPRASRRTPSLPRRTSPPSTPSSPLARMPETQVRGAGAARRGVALRHRSPWLPTDYFELGAPATPCAIATACLTTTAMMTLASP
jgi:hypothetical protein